MNLFFAVCKQKQHNINICVKLKFKCNVHAAEGETAVACGIIKVSLCFKVEVRSLKAEEEIRFEKFDENSPRVNQGINLKRISFHEVLRFFSVLKL